MTEAETRIVQALERLAAAMERAYPPPAKDPVPVVVGRSLVTGLPIIPPKLSLPLT